MAVQVALAMGCRVLGTAGSSEKCDYVVKLGASQCFNYTSTTEGSHWWLHVLDATDGRGVDVVFDPVGLVDLSIKCIAHQGKILIVGFAGREGEMEKIAMNRVLLKQVTLIGYVSSYLLRRNLRACTLIDSSGLARPFGATPKKELGSGESSCLCWRAERLNLMSPNAIRDSRVFLKH